MPRPLFDKRLARMTPDRAAGIIVGGMLRGKARVLVGLDAHLLHHIAKLPARATRTSWPRRLSSQLRAESPRRV